MPTAISLAFSSEGLGKTDHCLKPITCLVSSERMVWDVFSKASHSGGFRTQSPGHPVLHTECLYCSIFGDGDFGR